ncbi:MAG: AEC family transporter [Candidatus Omnitrophica bacterium]|nr:AEC family transporter [Candidatus Omnitrophota bacterium]
MTTIAVTLKALLGLFLLCLLGYLGRRREIIGKEGVSVLTKLVIGLTLPAMIFHGFGLHFSGEMMRGWWLLPLVGAAIFAFNALFGWLILLTDRSMAPWQRRQFMAMSIFHNAGYMPIPIVAAVLPAGQREEIFLFIFLVMLAFGPLIWTLGVWLMKGPGPVAGDRASGQGTPHHRTLSMILNPPFVTTVAALALALLGWIRWVPAFVWEPLRWLGDCTIPLVLLTLGAMLADLRGSWTLSPGSLLRLVAARLILPGAVMALALPWVPLAPAIKFLLLIQVCMPSAMTLAIIAREYSESYDYVAQSLMASYLIALATLPVFLTLAQNMLTFTRS